MSDFINPLVSVVVITYNSSKYVLETLESVYNQTYKNIELIISDDASKDNTIDICRNWIDEFGSRFKRTSIVATNKNKGVPANCNRGIKDSNGEWIKLIAGDDILLKNCINTNVEFTNKSNCSLVYSNLLWFNEKTIIETNKKDEFNRQLFCKLNNNQTKLKFYSRQPVFLNTPSWFLSKNIFKILNYDESFKIVEDQPFVFDLLKHNFTIKHLNTTTVKYRKHINSVQAIKNTNFISDFHYCYTKHRKSNLSNFSIIDLSFKINYYLFLLNQISHNNKLLKILVKFVSIINIINILNIKPNFKLQKQN